MSKCPQILPKIDQNKQLKDQDLDPSNCRSGFGSRGSTNVDPLRIRIANTVHNTKENAKALFSCWKGIYLENVLLYIRLLIWVIPWGLQGNISSCRLLTCRSSSFFKRVHPQHQAPQLGKSMWLSRKHLFLWVVDPHVQQFFSRKNAFLKKCRMVRMSFMALQCLCSWYFI